MTVDPTLVITIDCAGMTDPTDISFYGQLGAGELGVTDFPEPVVEPLNRYATQSDYEDGQEPRGATMLNTLLAWDFVTDLADTEQESRLLIARVRLAIRRLRYAVTVTVVDADPEVWQVKGYGSLTPPSRTLANLTNHDPVWGISLPVDPNRTI